MPSDGVGSFTIGLLTGSLGTALVCWLCCRKLRMPSRARLVHPHTGDYKMVMVVRTDLKMGTGKVAAQCAHAAIGCFKTTMEVMPEALEEWNESCGQAKVVLKCSNEQELLEIRSNARKQGIVSELIRDAGRTQIQAGSVTVLGIGPADSQTINAVTGHLKLL